MLSEWVCCGDSSKLISNSVSWNVPFRSFVVLNVVVSPIRINSFFNDTISWFKDTLSAPLYDPLAACTASSLILCIKVDTSLSAPSAT
jgi:hypothetical protein